MDRPTLAEITKLTDKIGYVPVDAEYVRALDCLVEASELVRDAADEDWLNTAGTAVVEVPPVVERIVVAAAYRGFDNPRGLSQRTVGDDSRSWDRAGVGGQLGVFLTDRERAQARRAAGSATVVSVTLVTPFSGDDETGLVVS